MKHRLALIFGLTALTALLFAADLTAGSSGMPLSAVLNALWAGPSGQSPEALILWSLRLPMTLTALFVGAALALAGLQIQTITANALASPSTLGITSGASFGAALAITAGFTVGGELWLGTMTASFLASLLICALILALGRLRGMTLTTLSIGEERAKSLGIQVSRLRLLVFSTASVLIAASVSFIGTIAFVGLVAPHCAKLLLGDDQRFLMPASMLFGGAILLLSSLLSKFISTGAMLPVGIITSIVGVPFLFVLLLKNRRDY